jgi:hypothetical protein
MKLIALVLAVLVLAVAVTPAKAEMPPQLPSSFYGWVSGYPVGTTINVWVAGVKVTTTKVFDAPGYGIVYSVNVGTGNEGDAVVFKTAGKVLGRGVFHSGTNVRLDLGVTTLKVRQW